MRKKVTGFITDFYGGCLFYETFSLGFYSIFLYFVCLILFYFFVDILLWNWLNKINIFLLRFNKILV